MRKAGQPGEATSQAALTEEPKGCWAAGVRTERSPVLGTSRGNPQSRQRCSGAAVHQAVGRVAAMFTVKWEVREGRRADRKRRSKAPKKS
jgi:hypothetical protein